MKKKFFLLILLGVCSANFFLRKNYQDNENNFILSELRLISIAQAESSACAILQSHNCGLCVGSCDGSRCIYADDGYDCVFTFYY